MRTVLDILQEKGSDVYTVPADATVFQALQIMAEKDVGALMVVQDDAPVGLLSERDYARKIALKGKLSRESPVSDIMTADMVRVGPQEDIEGCMELMTYKRVRYLPVFSQDRLMGIISLGDIVRAIIEHKQEVISQLENYIRGRR